MSEQKTKVKFLIERPEEPLIEDGKTVFAFFPDEVADMEGNATSYAHIGQHSACSEEYADECRDATPVQYEDLKSELEGIGYELEIINQ